MTPCILILDNLRSLHNVGSILRTADGFGITNVYACGITPYLSQEDDERLPHVRRKADAGIAKTALGAEKTVTMQHFGQTELAITRAQTNGYSILALEQATNSQPIQNFNWPNKVALVVGNEPNGVDQRALKLCDATIEIPMLGQKNSHNVVVATAIALTLLRLS